MEKYRLQQYEDGTFGYLGIDGDRSRNFTTDSYVVCTQGEEEDRDDFIAKNGITFSKNQYGSNERLDRLVNCEDEESHVDVACYGYGLEKLVNDESDKVREAVAENGYGLEKLVNDESDRVRKAVAKNGYGLDKLVNDKEPGVRTEVAKQGYGLDILYGDSDYLVRKNAKNYLVEHHLTLTEWVLQDGQSLRNK